MTDFAHVPEKVAEIRAVQENHEIRLQAAEARVSEVATLQEQMSAQLAVNNTMTADIHKVFKEIEPGFKFLTTLYAGFAKMLIWSSKTAKILIPILMFGYMVYMLVTKGVVPVGL